MKNIFVKKLISTFFILLIFLAPISMLSPINVLAQEEVGTSVSDDENTGFNLDFTIPNPIKVDNFDGFMAKLMEIIFLIAIPIITIFIIYSGFLFVTAQGNAEKIETAKRNFMWVLIGAAILLASWLLANAIGETIKQTFAP